MTFGGQTDEAEARRLVDLALDSGVTRFDTANVYNRGRSEEILGRCLRGRRATVATKVGGRYATEAEGLGRDHILRECDASLKRLGLERIDTYYMHQPDPKTPIEESVGAMDHLLRAGKIGAVGASNFAAWQVVRMMPTITVVQPMYNLLARDVEREFLPMCRETKLRVLAYNPLAGGLLTGKHRPGDAATGTRFDGNEMYRKRYWLDAMFRAVGEYGEVARRAGRTIVQLAFQWLRAQGVGILLGASRLDHLRENLAALDGTLDETTLQACDEVYARLAGPVPKYNR
ncbi:MAG: aldo/keto reductase [Planctomycetes bacterium]|nr:aldo/keto reductase [Planctomycetota bacterium]